MIDILVQSRRDRSAATCFFRKLLKAQGRVPRRLVTDKLLSYGAARQCLHVRKRWLNNRGVRVPEEEANIEERYRLHADYEY